MTHTLLKCRLLTGLLCLAFTTNAQVSSADTLKLVSYNALNFENTPSNNRAVYFRTVLSELQPDILMVQELIDGSGAALFRDSVMVAIDTNYAMAPFISSFDTDRNIYYRKDKLEVLEAVRIDTELRDIQQYKLNHIESGTAFYVFTLHLKATSGDDAQRAREIDSLLKVTAMLPDSLPRIVGGDFNIYDENEPAYINILDDTQPGYFIDPLRDSLSTVWNNAGNARFHTQSTRTRSFGGGSTGGLDDRFDLMLFSPQAFDGDKMQYIDGSTYAFGNDGNHYNDSINSPPVTAVTMEMADALHRASDHLPLVAEVVIFSTQDTVVNDTTISSIHPDEDLNDWKVFPQPAVNAFRLTTAQTFSKLTVFSLDGKAQQVWMCIPIGVSEYSVEHLPAGYYLLVAESEKGQSVRPFVKANAD